MPQLAIAVTTALILAVAGIAWMWQQSSRPSHEAREIALLRTQLADEMARNDKLAARSDRLNARVDALETELEIIRSERESDREEMRAEMDELLRGIQRLIEQLEQAKMIPVWRPSPPKPHQDNRPRATTLAARIADRFDIEEMNNLAFDLGIHKSDFGGETRETRARELVSLARRMGVEKSLISRVKELRQ